MKSGSEIHGGEHQYYGNFKHLGSDATQPPPFNEDHTQSLEGTTKRENLSDRHHSMWKACIEGDYVAAEMLLEGDPNLGRDEISEEGDRALHVAASMKHQQLVRKLVEKLSPSEIALLDGRGYTACCYAAMSGAVDIADLLIEKNPNLATARDRGNVTPLEKAAERGDATMVSCFLRSTKGEDLSTQEWFHLLLLTIRRQSYGVALEILGIDEQLATMSGDEGTALHLLAGQCFYIESRALYLSTGPFSYFIRWFSRSETMQKEMRLLAEKLLAGIQRLGQHSAVELLKNPPILHKATEVANPELVTMLAHAFPQLIWHTDSRGYTIFHIAVKHRHERLFELINKIGARKDLIVASQDEDGNNILHLAGKLGAPKMEPLRAPAFEMQREMLWFEKVKKNVPPLCWEMKNKDKETARELFVKKHKSLLEESRTWTRNVSDSCMLISTLIFSVVFGATFSVPGGYNQETGIPLLLGVKWFTMFAISEGFALLLSAFSILCFLNIMLYSMEDVHFAWHIPTWFTWGVQALQFSIIAALAVFLSAYSLMYYNFKKRDTPAFLLLEFLVMLVFLTFYSALCFQAYLLLTNNAGERFWKTTFPTLF